jgi:hypothetical protein
MSRTPTLTWNRIAALTTLVLFASIFLGVFLAAHQIFLRPPLFLLSPYFYALLGFTPSLVVLIVCVRSHPTGKRLLLILLTMINVFVVLIYLVIIGPFFVYSDIKCSAGSRSGLIVHQECVCISTDSEANGQVNCASNRIVFSPFIRLSE